MADEAEIVLEDDYHYLAVSKMSDAETGTVCILEIGRGAEAPDDRSATLLMLSREGVESLISALGGTLP